MKIKNKGLGRGLDALINPDFYEESTRVSDITSISINKIEQNINQPRSRFDEEKIQELSASIKKEGVLQPILVRKTDQGGYQIIAGERRWRASIAAGLKTIPAIVRDCSETEALAVALIENLQREDLNIMEQARALERLKSELGINQEQLAEHIGKSRSHLANTLRLMNLPKKIQELILENVLSAGHARALLSLRDQKTMLEAADTIVNKNLSVRETEKLIQLLNKPQQKKKLTTSAEVELTHKMQELISLKVNRDLRVNLKGTAEKGRLVISYTTARQLQDFLTILE